MSYSLFLKKIDSGTYIYIFPSLLDGITCIEGDKKKKNVRQSFPYVLFFQTTTTKKEVRYQF